jgi:hypothetical protein
VQLFEAFGCPAQFRIEAADAETRVGAGSLLAATTLKESAQAAGASSQAAAEALPSFRFPLGEQKPVTYEGGYPYWNFPPPRTSREFS